MRPRSPIREANKITNKNGNGGGGSDGANATTKLKMYGAAYNPMKRQLLTSVNGKSASSLQGSGGGNVTKLEDLAIAAAAAQKQHQKTVTPTNVDDNVATAAASHNQLSTNKFSFAKWLEIGGANAGGQKEGKTSSATLKSTNDADNFAAALSSSILKMLCIVIALNIVVSATPMKVMSMMIPTGTALMRLRASPSILRRIGTRPAHCRTLSR